MLFSLLDIYRKNTQRTSKSTITSLQTWRRLLIRCLNKLSPTWFRKQNINFFNFLSYSGLQVLCIDIVQTTISISTLYLSPFLGYMQKNKHVYKSGALVIPYNWNFPRYPVKIFLFIFQLQTSFLTWSQERSAVETIRGQNQVPIPGWQ